MAFDEVRLPVEIEYGAEGGAKFRTTIFQSKAGNEQRVSAWANRLGEWRVGYGLQDDDLRTDLITFFHARRGKFRGFRFRDWSDYKHDMTSSPAAMDFATGDNTVGPYQIAKTYSSGGEDYVRTIAKLVAPVVVTIEGSAAVAYTAVDTVDYTLDLDTGLLTWENAFDEDDVTVTPGSPTNILTSGAHGLASGDSVYLEGATGGQSALLNGTRFIVTLVDPNNFTVAVDTTGAAITGLDVHVNPDAEETLSWTGEFDVPVRLDEDLMKIELEFHQLSNWRGIRVVETREIQ